MADTNSTLTDEKRDWIATILGVNLQPAGAADQPPGAGAMADPGPGGGQVPANSSAAKPPSTTQGKAPAGLPDAMPAGEMKAEDIAAEIMDKQIAILVGWQTALQVFDKTMTSSADAEATPDYQKVVVGYFADKLMGALMSHAPGASELDAIVKALGAEYSRAAAAGASATLRDFVVQHAKAIGRLEQAILSQRQGFISAVRARRESAAAQPVKPGRKGAEPAKQGGDYAAMRTVLLDTLASVDKTLSASTPEALFRVLSEEWVRNAKVSGGMGTKFQAVVIIRLNPNYTIKDAHIQGAGGQKLAEQLLKDSPEGVDVFRLQAPRRILLLADNGWPSATLSLDANNRDTSTGSFAEGDTTSLRRYVMSKGLPPTKNLTGD